MSSKFSLEAGEFAGQEPAFTNAGSELIAAVGHLQATIAREGWCWGDDEPGREFEKTYRPDADKAVQDLHNLVAILHHTGTVIKQSADAFNHQDIGSAGRIAASMTGADTREGVLSVRYPSTFYQGASQGRPTKPEAEPPPSTISVDRPTSGLAIERRARTEGVDAPARQQTGAKAPNFGNPAGLGTVAQNSAAMSADPENETVRTKPQESIEPQPIRAVHPAGVTRIDIAANERPVFGDSGAGALTQKPATATARSGQGGPGVAGNEEMARHPWMRAGPRHKKPGKDRKRRPAIVVPKDADKRLAVADRPSDRFAVSTPSIRWEARRTPWSDRNMADRGSASDGVRESTVTRKAAANGTA